MSDITNSKRQAEYRERMKKQGYKRFQFYADESTSKQLCKLITESGTPLSTIIKNLINEKGLHHDNLLALNIIRDEKAKGISDAQIAKALTSNGLCNHKQQPYTKDQVRYLIKKNNL